MIIEILGLLFSIIIGTIGHFLYEWLNFNKFIGFLFLKKESVWEHMKLGITPIIIWTIIEFFTFKFNNLFFAKFSCIITFAITLMILYYSYKKILKKNILFLDILTFYISLAITYLIGINNINYSYSWYIYIPTIVFIISLIYAYLNFSKKPPNSFIFKTE